MLLNGFGVSNSYTFAEDVSDVLVAKVKENSATFKGVDVEVVPYRHIVDGTLAAHIIGTVGKINAEEYAELKDKGYGMNDMVGKSGIEYSMEEYLRGTDGEKVVTVDADGNVSETVTKEPVQGATVVLTIDADMQKLAQDTFAKWTENYAKSSKNKYGVPAAGALVVNDPNTGEILTILSYPTYDLNTYSEKYSELSKDERTPLWNRALRSTYAIGSTSKPSVAIAAIEEGLTNRDRVIRCTREFKYLDHTFYCNINHKDRNLTLRTALQDSCNIYFYTCGEELGVSRLNEYRSMLGLGVKTGVELTEAEAKYLNDDDVWVTYDVEPGMQHLDGMAALCYARMRKAEGDSDSDIKRTTRQRQLIEVLLNKVRNLSLSELEGVADTLLPLITTTMKPGDIASLLVKVAPLLSRLEIESHTIPIENESLEGSRWGDLIDIYEDGIMDSVILFDMGKNKQFIRSITEAEGVN